ncbi:hypothetical protein BFS13_14570 [Pantoea sp. Ae16]|nr:hypothetical protein BFS13_14570 [Pantoea sp. Ae16]
MNSGIRKRGSDIINDDIHITPDLNRTGSFSPDTYRTTVPTDIDETNTDGQIGTQLSCKNVVASVRVDPATMVDNKNLIKGCHWPVYPDI